MGSLSLHRDRKTLTRWVLVEIHAKSSTLAQEINCTSTEKEATSEQQRSDIRGELSSLLAQQISNGAF